MLDLLVRGMRLMDGRFKISPRNLSRVKLRYSNL